MEEYNLESSEEWTDRRLDKVLSEYFNGYSRSFIKKLFDEDMIHVNSRSVKPSYKVKYGDMIDISVPDPVSIDIEPEDIPLNIIYEDDDVILVNKPKGMVVHPAPGHYRGTLVNGLMYHFAGSLSGINGEFRPGIVHRIDMDTTGVLVVCKNDNDHRLLSEQLHEHSITRKYYAIVNGNIAQDEGTVDAPIGRSPKDRKKMAVTMKNSKPATTHFEVIKRYGEFTHVRCILETGRTHQIRVHMAYIGHPVAGDPVYGPKKVITSLNGQCLHAKHIGFVHPITNEYLEFESELPEYFTSFLNLLEKKYGENI